MLALPPALQQRDFRLLWTSMLASGVATQMAAVAIGWQVYAIHHKAFDLGLIGLAEFAPVPLLALPTGHLADRVSRTRLVALSTLVEAGVVALLLVVTLGGAHQLWQFIALAAATGAAAQLGNPAARSLTPQIVTPELLPGAIALRSIAGQAATIGGPAVGGLLFAIDPETVYALATALLVVAAVTVAAMHSSAPIEQTVGPEPALRSLLGGIVFIRDTPVMLGAISLDLFAVLFGGATALLPLYAKSILHTGPFGLGVLRSSIAVGALLAVVALFGASMIVFGLSRWFVVSAVALGASGFVDMISMNIRSMIAAVATPNGLRGRVNAVEGVFIGASNELGAFESGAAAALVGAVPAVVAGGILTIGLAAVWRLFFPALSTVDRMEELAPA
ncbi:MAG TPA: MFS transporter [Gaiellaceae bacterium]|nr:MFS transporter [Gaiellaceae bacterium]